MNNLFLLRSKIWKFNDEIQDFCVGFTIIAGIAIILLSPILWKISLLGMWLMMFFGIFIFVGSTPIILKLFPFWFPPKPGYILYNNSKDSNNRDFDKLINHYGYEDDKIYCIIKYDRDTIFYYKKNDDKIYMKDIDNFFDNGWFIQIGYDKELADYGKNLDYIKLTKTIGDENVPFNNNSCKRYKETLFSKWFA